MGASESWALTEGADIISWGLGGGREMVGPFVQLDSSPSTGATCGISPDGAVECIEFVVPPPAGSYLKVSLSSVYYPACALRTDGSVVCWDALDIGPYFEGGWDPPSGAPFVDVATAVVMTCGLEAGGSVRCTGGAHYWMYWEDPPEGPFVQIGGGEYGTMCGVRVDGSIACWGLDELGEVSEAPVEGVYTYVSGGAASFCAVAVDGSLSCWGDCLGGVCEPPAGTFVSVSVGYDHACALTPEGEAVCWGTDTYGETVPP
jgi:hypothetical protein